MSQFGNKTDLLAGLMFAGVGLGAMVISREYAMGTAAKMGPGYFPTVLSALLVLIGLGISMAALRSTSAPAPHLAWRPIIGITLSVVLFGILIEGGGLAIAATAACIVSRLARSGHGWRETLVVTAVVVVLNALIFYYGLGLQFPLWPHFS